MVTLHKAYKFEVKPTAAQARFMRCTAGICRRVYNDALALQNGNYQETGKHLSLNALSKQLTAWRNDPETPWMSDAPRHTQQEAIKHLEAAFNKFFAHEAGYPNFKKKGAHENFTYPDREQIELDYGNNRIKLPKLGWVKVRFSRRPQGELRSVTVMLEGGRCAVV